MKYLSTKTETIKLLEKKVDINLGDSGLGMALRYGGESASTTKFKKINWALERVKVRCFFFKLRWFLQEWMVLANPVAAMTTPLRFCPGAAVAEA